MVMLNAKYHSDLECCSINNDRNSLLLDQETKNMTDSLGSKLVCWGGAYSYLVLATFPCFTHATLAQMAVAEHGGESNS